MLSKKLEQQKQEWVNYLNREQPHLLRESLVQVHPADQAEVLRTLDQTQLASLLNVVEDLPLRALFRFLRTDKAARLRVLQALPPQRRALVLSAMTNEAVAEIFKGFSRVDMDPLITNLSSQKKRDIQNLAETSGQGVELIMTRDMLTVRADKPVRDVVSLLHSISHSEGRPSQIYVIDHRGLLCGMIDLHLLLLAPDPDKPIQSIMKDCALRIDNTADPLAASRSLLYYGLGSAPVVNNKNELLGAFPADAAYRLLEADHDANLNCIGVVSGATQIMPGEPAAVTLRHSLALLPVLVIALASCIALRLFFIPYPAQNIASMLPWVPLFIAVNRLYFRHISLLLQKRSVAQEFGAAYSGRRVRVAMLLGAGFAPLSGAAAGLLAGGHVLFGAAVGVSVMWSTIFGAVSAWALFRATRRTLASRSIFMPPFVLSLGDLASVSGALGLYLLLI